MNDETDGAVRVPESADGQGRVSSDIDSQAWYDGIENPDHRRFAERFATPADLAKIGYEYRERLARSFAVPGQNAGQGEIDEYRRRLGVPADPDGYFHRGEIDLDGIRRPGAAPDPLERKFAEAMHVAGATPEVFDAAVAWYRDAADRAIADKERFDAEARGDAQRALEREWGAGYSKRLEYARRMIGAYGGPELRAKLDSNGFGNDPAFIRMIGRFGEELAEDEPPAIGSGDGFRQSLEERERELRGRKDRWSNPEVERELREIGRKIWGTDSHGGGFVR